MQLKLHREINSSLLLKRNKIYALSLFQFRIIYINKKTLNFFTIDFKNKF